MQFTYTGIIVALVIVTLYNTIKILREYERGVVFLLGRFYKVKGPGLIILVPFIQTMMKVDLRVMVLDVPTQDVISRDNVSVHVNAVIYFRVVAPELRLDDPGVVALFFEPPTEDGRVAVGHEHALGTGGLDRRVEPVPVGVVRHDETAVR